MVLYGHAKDLRRVVFDLDLFERILALNGEVVGDPVEYAPVGILYGGRRMVHESRLGRVAEQLARRRCLCWRADGLPRRDSCR